MNYIRKIARKVGTWARERAQHEYDVQCLMIESYYHTYMVCIESFFQRQS